METTSGSSRSGPGRWNQTETCNMYKLSFFFFFFFLLHSGISVYTLTCFHNFSSNQNDCLSCSSKVPYSGTHIKSLFRPPVKAMLNVNMAVITIPIKFPLFLIYLSGLSEIQMTPRLCRATAAVRLVPDRVQRGSYSARPPLKKTLRRPEDSSELQVLACRHIPSLFARTPGLCH